MRRAAARLAVGAVPGEVHRAVAEHVRRQARPCRQKRPFSAIRHFTFVAICGASVDGQQRIERRSGSTSTAAPSGSRDRPRALCRRRA